jgi:hypothetical protein
MPVDFLTEEQKSSYGQFAGGPNETQLARYLLLDLTTIPMSVQTFIANQLSIRNLNVLEDYGRRETTRREHTALIRQQYGYHEFHSPPWSFRLSRLLYSRAWISNERPSLMFDVATTWLIQNRILLPGASTLTRLISEIRERATSSLWKGVEAISELQHKNRQVSRRTSGFVAAR